MVAFDDGRNLHAGESDDKDALWSVASFTRDGAPPPVVEPNTPSEPSPRQLEVAEKTARSLGFLPSIGPSSARESSSARRPHPPSGSKTDRGPRLPALNGASSRAARQREMDKAIFRKAFAVIDKDQSGTVEPDEVVNALKIFGKEVDRKRFWEVFKEADKDGNESLDVDEFVDMMVRVTEKTRKAKAARGSSLSRRFKHAAADTGRKEAKKKARQKFHGTGRKKRALTEGEMWMEQALTQQRGLGDIYAARKRLQRAAMGIGLLEPEEDPRMRTLLGRRLVAQEAKAAKEAAHRKANPVATMGALDKFAQMFGKAEPETAPAAGSAPAAASAPAPAPAPAPGPATPSQK